MSGQPFKIMENTSQTDSQIFEDFAKDFIVLKFKGQDYESTIKFVEIVLNQLKEDFKNSSSSTIKDILGR